MQSVESQLLQFEKCRQRGEEGRSFSHLSLALLLSPHLKHSYYSTYLQIFERWSGKVEANQGLQKVLTLFEVALNHYPESPDLNYLLATTLYRHGSVHEAWNHAFLSLAKCPRDPWCLDMHARLTNCLVDRWHIPMLNDGARNAAFQRAITAAVKDGCDTLLDIGSGTGLLSIYAKRAGASKVYGCEEDKFMQSMCSSVLQMNKHSTDITIFNKHSRDISTASDIPQKVSLVVSEIVDAGLFGEHILSTLEHAWQHLLLPPLKSQDNKTTAGAVQPRTFPQDINPVNSSQESDVDIDRELLGNCPNKQEEQLREVETGMCCENVEENESKLSDEAGVELHNRLSRNYISKQEESVDFMTDDSLEYGRVIPARAEVFIAIITCSYVAKQTKYLSPDIECLKNKYVHVKLEEPYMSEKLTHIPGGFKLLSEWMQLTTIDFNSPEDISKHLTGKVNKALSVKATEDGPLDAIVLAFNLHLDENNCIRTFPDSSVQSVWENAVYPVVHPITVTSGDTINLEFECHGVIKLSVQDQLLQSPSKLDSVKISINALRFLNSKSFVGEFISAAHQIFNKIQQCRKIDESTATQPITICDTLPFPAAGLYLQSLLPDSLLYVEDEEVQKVLQELGVDVSLCEEIQEGTLDVLFIWPVTQEGTLADGIVENIKKYRMLLQDEGLVFPQEVDVVVDVLSSPLLEACVRVNDVNTCGLQLAEVFNLVQTTQQLDVTLNSLPDTTRELNSPVHLFRLSLLTGRTESLVKAHNSSTQDISKEILALGGQPLEAVTCVTSKRHARLIGLPYWFDLRSKVDHPSSVSFSAESQDKTLPNSTSPSTSSDNLVMLSTLSEDSPCNQSVFILKNPMEVKEGEEMMLKALWRKGVFSLELEQRQ